MKQKKIFQFSSLILILFALFSFFYGFYIDEIPMGSGGYDGDFKFVKKSIQIFSNNSLGDSILLFSDSSNRPPLIYILHKIFNPFFSDEINFRRVIFFISLNLPILFFLCLKEKFKKTDNILLALLASTILLNPFFRNSSFWGLEENYSIITSLISLLFLLKLQNFPKVDQLRLYFKIFILLLFSSLCVYFDQKFVIIPLICFLKIITDSYSIKIKIFTVVLYILFAVPYLFLIKMWGGIFPTNNYHIGEQFYPHHFGFALTMIAFIFFPFTFFDRKNLKNRFFDYIKGKKLHLSFIIILSYIFFFSFIQNDYFILDKLDGGGIIKKISFIFFDDFIIRKIFIAAFIFISWFYVMFVLNKNLNNYLLTFYFLSFSVITKPFYQEYYDPIIFFLLFFIYKINFNINYKNTSFFYLFFLIFLISANYYYN
jgi:hypothetical protein